MNRYLKLLIAGLTSIVGIYIAFRGENLESLWSQILQIDKVAFYSANLLLLLSCVIRAYRWGLLIEPIEKIGLKHLFSSTMIGYFGNGVLDLIASWKSKIFCFASHSRHAASTALP